MIRDSSGILNAEGSLTWLTHVTVRLMKDRRQEGGTLSDALLLQPTTPLRFLSFRIRFSVRVNDIPTSCRSFRHHRLSLSRQRLCKWSETRTGGGSTRSQEQEGGFPYSSAHMPVFLSVLPAIIFFSAHTLQSALRRSLIHCQSCHVFINTNKHELGSTTVSTKYDVMRWFYFLH